MLYRIDQVCFPAEIAFSRGEFLFYLSHSKSITRVAEGPGGILGFVLAKVDARQAAHVVTLDVIPEARRRKIGTALMKAFHKEISRQGIWISILEVGVGNTPAQRLYEKLGYERVQTLKGYYHGAEDAYRMLRSS